MEETESIFKTNTRRRNSTNTQEHYIEDRSFNIKQSKVNVGIIY